MNKKGFTLIELLAVIVILAIIALIATPVIMNAIGSAKQKAFLDSAYGLVKAAELSSAKQVNEQEDNGYMVFTFNNGVLSSGNSNVNLDYKGSTPQDGIIIVNELNQTDISIYDGTNCATKRYTDTNVTTSTTTKDLCLQSSRDVLKAIIDAEATELLTALSTKKSNEPTFDLTTINETNVSSIFNATIENYKSLKVNMDGSNPNIVLVGKGNWDTYLVSGTSTNKVVNQGLVVYLDAANQYSYPGTGTTWYDLSGNGNDFIISGAEFIVAPNHFQFGDNQVDQIYKNNSVFMSNLNSITASIWVRGDSVSPTGGIISYAVAGADNEFLVYGMGSGFELWWDQNVKSFGYVLSPNIWYNFVYTVSPSSIEYYINGSLAKSFSSVNKSITGGGYFVIGQEQDAPGTSFSTSQDYVGDFAKISIYNRALSLTEIQENYNSIKDIFGL